MKTMSVLFVVCFGVSSVLASTPKGSAEGVNWAKAEKNYIANLHSENTGVVTSTANHIRRYKLTGAADELIELLSADRTDNVKIAAAWALVSVCGEEGREAVEEAANTEENEMLVTFYRTILASPVTAER